jgi:MFS family permease
MEDKLTFKAAIIQIIFAVIANLTCLSPGMGLAFPAITSEILLKEGVTKLTQDQVSWFASLTLLVCPIGGPISSYLVNKFGRKISLILINVLSLTHWIISALSSQTNSQNLFIQLIIARVICGIIVGMVIKLFFMG